MAVISNGDLQTWLDKLARWAGESVGDPDFANDFNAGMDAANANVFTAGTSFADFIVATADNDVIADLLPAARDLEEDPPTPSDGFLLQITSVQAEITAMNRHIARYGNATSLDNYLTALNASTPTLRAHANFRKYLKTLSAKNTFVGVDTVLATFAATGATTGTYTHVAALSTSQYAGAKLVVKNQGAVTTGATLTVTGKKLDGTTASLTATIATGTDNTETNLSSTLRLFVDVTAISITGGTNANVYEIVAKTDRDISAV